MPKKFLRNHKATNTYKAYLALLAATAIWGAAGPIIKLTLQYLPVHAFLFLRFLIVCTVLLPITIIELKKEPVETRDIPNLIILGLLSQSSILIVFWGYKFAHAIDASLIGAMHPLMAIAAGYYFYKEEVTKFEKIGIAVATLGTLVIILEPLLTGQQGVAASELRFLGNLLILLYQLTWLSYILWSRKVMGHRSPKLTKIRKWFHAKPMKKKYSPLLLTMLTFYVGLATMIPLAFLEALGVFGGSTFSTSQLTPTPVLGLLYMALLSSIVAYLLFQWGINKSEVSDAGFFTYLGPLFTVPTAFILLGEIPSSTILVGAGIVACGVIIAEKEKG